MVVCADGTQGADDLAKHAKKKIAGSLYLCRVQIDVAQCSAIFAQGLAMMCGLDEQSDLCCERDIFWCGSFAKGGRYFIEVYTSFYPIYVCLF